MPLICLGDAAPRAGAAAFVAPGAVLAGDVALGWGASVWYGAVLRADSGRIIVGEDTNIQDNAVIHTGTGRDVRIGARVSIGHGALVHGCTVGDGCLVGMHATVLDGAVLGEGCLIAAGALVPEGAVIPPRSLVMGVPGRVRGTLSDERVAALDANVEEYLALAARHAAANRDGKGAGEACPSK